MSPRTKKLLSAFGVTVAFAALGTLNTYVVRLPNELQAGALAALAGAAHFLSAWGTKDEIDAKVTNEVTAAISGEAK